MPCLGFTLFIYSNTHPYFFKWTCLQYMWNQIIRQDTTSVLMWGTNNTQCWRRRCLVHISFWNTLFTGCICISENVLWCTYQLFICFITNKLGVVIIETFRRIHYFLVWFFQFYSYISQFFCRKICLYLINNFMLIFPGP